MYLMKVYYSPLHNANFTIVHVHNDRSGEPILTGEDDNGSRILFRISELTEAKY